MPGAASAVLIAIKYVGAAASAVMAGTATLAQIATVAGVGIGAGVGSVALSKALTPQIGSQGAAVQWIADPDEPLHFAFGRVGVKGAIKDAAIYGPDRMYVSFACTVSAAGPIQRFVSFRAGDHIMSFDAGGKAVNEPYRDEMWLSTRLGSQPDTALSLPTGLKNGASFPGWNASRKLSGSAAYMVTLGENSKRSAYEGKVPAFVATIEGLFCYDPRLDDTYPGGSGPCRLNDPSTWVWTRNPILFALKWALGLWEGPNGKGAPQVDYQVGGIGAKVESIRLSTVVEAANISYANGWTSAAWPSTDDDKAQVLDGFLKAGGARYAEIAGQMAFIHRAAPRSPVFTITARDTCGPVEIDTASSKLNRINTIRARYWSEAHEWEMTALPEVTSSVWQIEDGQGGAVKRTRGADYTFVDQAKQARELASLEISNSREGIKGRVPLRPYMDPEPGNCFIFDEPDFALSQVKCFVTDVEDDTDGDQIIVTFESETDGKYPFAYGQTGNPPPAQELSPYDPTYVTPPTPDDWIIEVRPPAPGGGQLPAFDLKGAVSNPTATAVLVEYGPTEGGPWKQAYEGPPTVEIIPIDGLQPGETYYIAVSYRRDQNYSDRQVFGPYTAPGLIAGDLPPDHPLYGSLDGFRNDLRKLWSETAILALDRYEADRQRTHAIMDEVEDRVLADREGQEAIAAAIIESKDYTDDFEAWARINLATVAALADGLSSTLLTAFAHTDAFKAQAEISYATKTERANGDASTLNSARSYTDALEAWSRQTLATQAQMGQSAATTLSQAQSYTNGQITLAMSLVYTRAQSDAAVAQTLQEAKSYTDAYKIEAGLIFASQVGLDGVSSQAALALQVAQNVQTGQNEARARIIAEAVDGKPAFVDLYSDNRGSRLGLAAGEIWLVNIQNGLLIPVMRSVGGNAEFYDGVRIYGDLVVDGSINGQLKATKNTYTPMAAAYTAAQTFAGLNSWVEVQSITQWCNGAPVILNFNAYVVMRHEPAGSFMFRMKVERMVNDGSGLTEIYFVEMDALVRADDTIQGMMPISLVDRPPSADSYRYRVSMMVTQATMTVRSVSNRFLSVMELSTNS